MREILERLEGSKCRVSQDEGIDLTEESTGRYVMEKILPLASVRKIKKNSDDQTGDLAMKVYLDLVQRIDGALGREGQEALNRLSSRNNYAGKDDSGIIRNNIFKAAHALKMKLPSMMF